MEVQIGTVYHNPTENAIELDDTDWTSTTIHKDSQGNSLELSRSSTLVVAASDASAKSKAGADTVCTGTADDVDIQAAIDAIYAVKGGVVQLSEGAFNSGNINVSPTVTLRGMGYATQINMTGTIQLKGSIRRATPDAGRIHNLRVSVATGYTGNAIYIKGSEEIGEIMDVWDNIWMDAVDVTGGKAVFIDADNLDGSHPGASFTLCTTGKIYIRNFQYGVYINCANTAAQDHDAFINGNHFGPIILWGQQYGVYLKSEIAGSNLDSNIFDSIIMQAESTCVEPVHIERYHNQFRYIIISDLNNATQYDIFLDSTAIGTDITYRKTGLGISGSWARNNIYEVDTRPTRTDTETAVARSTYAQILSILGTSKVAFYPFAELTGTTSSDESLNGHDLTASANLNTFDNAPEYKASVVRYRLNGTDEWLDIADHADFTHGDGTNDSAFSLGIWINTDVKTTRAILAKYDETTGSTNKEYYLGLDASGYPQLILVDDSASAYIGRRDSVAVTNGAWTFVVGTYDGGSLVGGIKVYVNGVQADDANVTSGSYTAMEDKAAKFSVGYLTGSGGSEAWLFDGALALPFTAGKELSADEVWQLYQIGKGLLNV